MNDIQVTNCATCKECKWYTYKWNKLWCDLKSEPYPQKACDKWEPKENEHE